MKHLTFVMPDCKAACTMTVHSTQYGQLYLHCISHSLLFRQNEAFNISLSSMLFGNGALPTRFVVPNFLSCSCHNAIEV